MNLSKIKNIHKMIGKKVKLLIRFSDIPAGTIGTIENVWNAELHTVMVRFASPDQKVGFIKSLEEMDETTFLELVGGA